MDEGQIIVRVCPLCGDAAGRVCVVGAATRHPLWRPWMEPTIRWRECASCSHIYAEGIYSGAGLDRLLEAAHVSQVTLSEAARIEAHGVVEFVTHGYAPGLWLDVGAGSGALLAALRELGYSARGCDLRGDGKRIERCEAETWLERMPPASADVVSMLDVIEHVQSPRRLVEQAARVVKPGGEVLISTPIRGSEWWDSCASNPYWFEVEHAHIFSRAGLEGILVDAGLRVRKRRASRRYRFGVEFLAARPE